MIKNLTGTGVALITPFTSDNQVDVTALEKLVEYNVKGGVEYLVLLGTTSESPTLTSEEKELVKKTIIRVNKKRIPLVLGVGGNTTAGVLEELKKVDKNEISAILSVAPYYNKPSQEGLYYHYRAISESTELPIILYNVPHRTGCNILPQTVARIQAECKNIIGIKEAGGSVDQALELLKLLPRDFLLISGDDTLALPEVFMGFSGCISVIANGIPEHYSQMIRYGLQNNVEQSTAIFHKIAPLISSIYEEGNPVGIKVVLNQLIGSEINVRLPLINASEKLQDNIKDKLSLL